MKEWLTAREIADEKLPDLPTTESALIRFAERNAWDSHPAYARARKGRGGGFEYHYRILPTLAQVAYVQRYMVVGEETPAPAANVDAAADTGRAREERDARLAVIAAFEKFSRGLRLNRQACIAVFCDRYQMGFIKVDDWVKDKIPSVSRRSLWRWMSARNTGKTEALGFDRSKARAGSGLLETANNGAVQAFILTWIARNPALSADIIRGYCEDYFGSEIVDRNGEVKPLPPLRTFQHFIAHLKASKKVLLTMVTDPDRFRSTMKLSGTGTHVHVTEPNALWMIDASPVDALCLDGRYSMYCCLDIATRRTVITLSKTPRASAVGLLIRKATLKWGVATEIKTDNGSDFVAIAIKRLFDNLGIEPNVSDAYSPEQKGHVERAIRTFQHEVCPQLEGYIGHSVADRKVIEGRKSFAQRLGADEKELFEVALTAEQLQAHIDEWVDYIYHERAHGGLKQRTHAGMVERSPNQVANASTSKPRRVDERALDALLMPLAGKNGRRKMTKQGIKHDHFYYLSGSIMVGTDVICRLDPIDMAKMYVFDAKDGRFLDVALCPILTDVNRPAHVQAQKDLQKEMLAAPARQLKADLRELKKGPSGIERTIRLARKKYEERQDATANVIRFPKGEEQHSTPAIEAALASVTAPRVQPAKSLNEAAAKLHEAIVREAEQKATAKVVHLDPDAGLSEQALMFKWAMATEEMIASGIELDDATAVRLVRFQSSSAYQVMKDLVKDFGLENALRMS
jgi:putative transposase